LAMPKEQYHDGTLRNYLYHSIFDIAGTGSNEKFIYPIAMTPVYAGFSSAMKDLMGKLIVEGAKLNERGVYFDFLYDGFKKAFPEFEEQVFRPLCEDKNFRHEAGLVVLRILALTRNTYKNAQKVLDMCKYPPLFPTLVKEMSAGARGPQIMLYYAPDMLRMGLGLDLADETGANMQQALGAMEGLYRSVRDHQKVVDVAHLDQYQLNVQPVVTEIKNAGKSWTGGDQLKVVCENISITSNELNTEGIVVVLPASTS